MKSKWFHLKNQAIKLRKKGKSIRDIEIILKIPRSTLSGWLRGIKLTQKQKNILKRKWEKALVKARGMSVIWHNKQKEERLKTAENDARKLLSFIDLNDKKIIELALAMIYLGEGSKTKDGTAIGNSDPIILRFFVTLLQDIFNINVHKIGCNLHLRADQDPIALKKYWSKELGLPLTNFKGVSIDKRTVGKPTYSHYKGVCVVYCGNIAIQRKLVYLSKVFCEEVSRKFGRLAQLVERPVDIGKVSEVRALYRPQN